MTIVAVATELYQFQQLYRELRDGGTHDGWGPELVLPWLEARPELVLELGELGRPENHRVTIPRDPQYHWPLAGLYALSRIIDILISAFQPVNDDPSILAWTTNKPWWEGPIPSRETYVAFARALRSVHIAESTFHPFFHEIVSVEQAADPDEAPTLTHEYWPGLLAGGLLLVRSGVGVRAGANHVDPDVAARSCLYWTWWRRNRKVMDLSHGWGSSSQWGTDFRRDYVTATELHYNVDGPSEAARTARFASALSEPERLMLVRHRCSLRTDLGDDQFPYRDFATEPR